MTPLWTTAILPDWSRCGWEFSSDGRAVRGPAGVADAEVAGGGFGFNNLRQALVNFALFLAHEQVAPFEHGHAGAVVTAIFQPPQSFQQDGRGRFVDVN